MTEENVKQIVKDTIEELLGKSMIKYSDLIIYEKMSDRLREYYKTGNDPDLAHALDRLKDHPHIQLIEDYYKYNYTLEAIANDYGVEVRTISRRKKNLCIKIYKIIESN